MAALETGSSDTQRTLSSVSCFGAYTGIPIFASVWYLKTKKDFNVMYAYKDISLPALVTPVGKVREDLLIFRSR